ncbi:MAG: FecR domain-containing protein [Sulfuriferula sp.]|nr:FecR domain-containing protein [Sulfuriferula sp.]
MRLAYYALLFTGLSCTWLQSAQAVSPPADELLYTTQRGDTLIDIGKQLNKPDDWKQLQKLNHIQNPRLIPTGSILHIPVALLRSEDAPAKVISVVGHAQADQQPLTPNSLLKSGTEIVTGSDGFVLLQFANGTHLAVQADSRVTLTALKKFTIGRTYDSTVKLQTGRVETQAAKTAGPSPRYRITTPSAVMSVRGTQFRVASDDTQTSRTEVTEGLVRVADADDQTAVGVAAGFGNIVTNDKPPMTPVALLPALDLTRLPTLQERPVIRFDLAASEGASAYRAQIADDAQFTRILRDHLFNSPSIKFDGLDDGKYWLRLRAVDRNGLEGLDAQREFVLKARPEPPFVIQPANNGKLSGEHVTFNWTLADDAASYHLQIAQQADFHTITTDADKLSGNTYTPAQALAPGVYFWRIASIRSDGDRGPYGDVRQFTLKPMPATPPPPVIGADSIQLSWSGEPGQTYELDIARDRQFKEALQHYTLSKPEISLPKPSWGIWFFRVRATDADSYVNPYTTTQRFEIPFGEWYWWHNSHPADE